LRDARKINPHIRTFANSHIKYMQNPRLAGRYAKSLIDLAVEKNALEQVYNDMLLLQNIFRNNREFVTIMRSPVILPDKKEDIFRAVAQGGRISQFTTLFFQLLIRKSREASFPEIVNAFIEQYKLKKNIQTVKLTTAKPVSEEVKQEIVRKVQSQSPNKQIDLKTEVREDLIGGFVLEMGDSLVDASISYDLKAIKKQFLNNDFIYKIR
jgi:F-type H+-transporting ATPase subunit delta